jgi:RNA polymerase sigma-70 factor (ECF subfamily)
MKSRPASQRRIVATTPSEHKPSGVGSKRDDAVLMERIALGDKSAYAEFLTRHLNVVVDFAGRYLRRRVDAEDVAQEAFMRVWRKAPDWRAQQVSPRSWLYRITYHLCIDELRRRRPDTSVQDAEDAADPGATPEESALRQARMGQLDRALRSLSERQRTAITLCAYHGLSNKEAAATLDITVEALESLLSRGRRRLRELLKLHTKGASS